MALRTRLALIGVMTLAATLLVVALLAYQIVRVTGRQSLDLALRQELADVQAGLPELLTEASGRDGALSASELRRAVLRYLALHPGSDRHLTVVTVGAEALATGDGPPELLALRATGTLPLGELGSLATADSPAGPIRVLTTPLVAGDREVAAITIVGPLAEVAESARRTLLQIGAAGAVGLVLGGLFLALATRRALAPLATLAEAARATTGSDDLGARVPEPPRRDEVGVLAHEFNGMLERIASDAERRRRLLATVSHELRTPLSVAKGHLEVFREVGSEDRETAAYLAEVLEAELDRLARIVDDLTAVVRGIDDREVELGALFIPDVFAELRERLAGLSLPHVEVAEAPPVVIEADQQRVAQSLLNLVLNAEVHTPPGTPVHVDARVVEGEVVLAVADTGPGIDATVRDEVFEPFVSTRTGGPARTAGLGLAVVRALTEAQGGRVSLDTGPGGTTVELRFRREVTAPVEHAT